VLIDEVLPVFEASEFHQTTVDAPVADVYAAIRTADLGGHWVIRALLALRALPSRLTRRRGTTSASSPITLDAIVRGGFALLAEDPDHELVLGVVGQFWRPTGNIAETDAVRFRQPLGPGMARAAWNFAVEPTGGGRTRLTTETRVQCGDAAARRSFRRYWLVVRPFSGLIRRVMLLQIARSCKGPAN
jgi:hypothetical protein